MGFFNGIKKLFGKGKEQHTSLPSKFSLAMCFYHWINIPLGTESKVYLSQHPELLTDEADAIISEIIQNAYDEQPDFVNVLEHRLDILRNARTNGIDEAFSDVLSFIHDVPADVLAELQTIQSKEELQKLTAEHPELVPILMMMAQQQGNLDVTQQQGYLEAAPSFASSIVEWFNAPDWNTQKAFLKENPRLLTDEAYDFMNEFMTRTRPDHTEQLIADMFEEHRKLLFSARTIGIDDAYTEHWVPLIARMVSLNEWIDLFHWRKRKAYMLEHPELLDDETDFLITFLIHTPNRHFSVNTLKMVRTVLRHARANGIDETMEKLGFFKTLKLMRQAQEASKDLIENLIACFMMPTWDSRRAYLHNFPDLLSNEADSLLEELIHEVDDLEELTEELLVVSRGLGKQEFLVDLKGYRTTLRYARINGIDATINELGHPAPVRHATGTRTRKGKRKSQRTRQAQPPQPPREEAK